MNKLKFGVKAGASAERQRGLKNVFKPHGVFTLEHWRDGKLLDTYHVPNGVTNGGIDKALDILFNDATAIIQDWAIGLINASGYSAVAAADTMSSHAGWTEFTSYSESTRPEWDPGTSSSQSITNSTPRSFNITSSGTLKGAFLSSDDTKGGTTGTLWATALFAADIPVSNGDIIKATYTTSGA